jgi:HK97 family phage major capsid protein
MRTGSAYSRSKSSKFHFRKIKEKAAVRRKGRNMANAILQQEQDNAAYIATLKTNHEGILATMRGMLTAAATDKRALSAEEQTTFDAKQKEADQIKATLKSLETFNNAYSDKPSGNGGGNPTQVHDNKLDEPWIPEARGGVTDSPRLKRSRVEYGFGQYLRAVRDAAGFVRAGTADRIDVRLLALNDGFQKRAAAAGASEMVPSDGSFLIAPDFSQEILMLAHDTGQIHSMCRKLPLSEFTNTIKIPAVDEQSRKDGFRFGGIQAFWENEAAQLAGSKPTFSQIELVCKKLTGLYYATNELIADARLLGSIVMQGFGEEFGFRLDDGVIRGTGAGQLLGILAANCLITIAKETGQATQTVVFENIKKMWGRMWPRSRKNSVWLVNQDVEQQLYGLVQVVGTGGVPVYLPPGTGVFGAAAGGPLMGDGDENVQGRLFGRPVIVAEQCATLGTAGDIILADWTQYMMVDKGDIQTASSMHVQFLSDTMTYRWIYRVDGQPWWKVAINPAQGTNTLSPFLVVAAR